MKKKLLFLTFLFSIILAAFGQKSPNDTVFSDPIPACYTSFYYVTPNCLEANCIGNTVQFIDSSSTGTIGWYWSFGDNNYSKEKNPVYTYEKAGIYKVCLETWNSAGCKNILCQEVSIAGKPECNADFYYYFLKCNDTLVYTTKDSVVKCQGNSVQFINLSNQPNVKCFWNFGDGSISTDLNPIHSYSDNSRNYAVKLTVYGEDSCKAVKYDSIMFVQNSCKAYFFAEATKCEKCGPNSMTFWAKAEGDVTEWQWNFGDSTISNEQFPTHEYKNAGLYYVCLTIKTSSGCSSSYCSLVQAGYEQNKCSASFYSYAFGCNDTLYKEKMIAMPCSENTYQFVNTSYGNLISTYWKFGDGTDSYDMNPVHTFPTDQAFYNVSLTVITEDSCISTYYDSIYIKGNNCDASFSYYFPKCEKCGVNSISFYPNNYNAVAYGWDFGDGTSSEEQYPTHEYANSGTYTVCLKIASAGGCSNYFCQTITIGNIIEPCKASFSWAELKMDCERSYKDCVSNGYAISFNDLSTGNIKYTHWVFGDGESSSQLYPVHNYEIAGKYPVTLVISGNDCANSYTEWIKVGEIDSMDCYANFYGEFATIDSGEYKTLYLKDLSTPSATKWFWEFGNGQISYDQNPVHTYMQDSDSAYVINLTISTNDGCSKRISKVFNQYFESWKVLKTNSVNTFESRLQLNTYPNPAQDIVTLELPGFSGEAIVQISDLMGKTVYSHKIKSGESSDNKLQINVSQLLDGNYICGFISQNSVYKGKLIIKK